MKKLWFGTAISCVFIIAELVGGWWAGSIAIMADAAHLSSDIIGFVVSIFALRLGNTYGWNRAEIIGTMVSISTIWVMTVWLFIEATWRFFEPP